MCEKLHTALFSDPLATTPTAVGTGVDALLHLDVFLEADAGQEQADTGTQELGESFGQDLDPYEVVDLTPDVVLPDVPDILAPDHEEAESHDQEKQAPRSVVVETLLPRRRHVHFLFSSKLGVAVERPNLYHTRSTNFDGDLVQTDLFKIQLIIIRLYKVEQTRCYKIAKLW